MTPYPKTLIMVKQQIEIDLILMTILQTPKMEEII
jgi:hypothetical protein